MFGHRGVPVLRLPIISSFSCCGIFLLLQFYSSLFLGPPGFIVSASFRSSTSVRWRAETRRSAERTKKVRWRTERGWTFHFIFATLFSSGNFCFIIGTPKDLVRETFAGIRGWAWKLAVLVCLTNLQCGLLITARVWFLNFLLFLCVSFLLFYVIGCWAENFTIPYCGNG